MNPLLLRAVTPSFKPTRFGRQRKPGLRYCGHFLNPGLRHLPPQVAKLER